MVPEKKWECHPNSASISGQHRLHVNLEQDHVEFFFKDELSRSHSSCDDTTRNDNKIDPHHWGGHSLGKSFYNFSLGRLCGTGQNQFWVRGRRRQSDLFQGKSSVHRYLQKMPLTFQSCHALKRLGHWTEKLSTADLQQPCQENQTCFHSSSSRRRGELAWEEPAPGRSSSSSAAHSHPTNLPPCSTLPLTAGTMGRGSGETSTFPFPEVVTDSNLVDSSSNLIHCHPMSSSMAFDNHLIGKYAPLLVPESGEAPNHLLVFSL